MESPIKTFRKEIPLSEFAMANECQTIAQRYILMEEGAIDHVPPQIIKLADIVRGPGEGSKLSAEFREFRANLGAEKIKELEKKLWPAGKAYGQL